MAVSVVRAIVKSQKPKESELIMATGKLDLWIDRKESHLGLERDQLTWRLHGKLKDRVPVKYVNTVTILGQTQLDSRLLCRLAECGVSVYLLNNAV